MKEWFSNLWTSESTFRAFARGCVAMAGALVPIFTGLPEWVAPVIVAASQFIAAGERNER